VSLYGEDSAISDNTGCPATATGVIDLTSQVATVAIGNSYTLSAAFITCGSQFQIYGGAFIDWNRDGIWDTHTGSTEVIFFSPSYITNVATFTVPSTASLCLTRMRVQVRETTVPDNPYDPCTSFAYGGTKDFTINIIKVGYCMDVGPSSTKDATLGPVTLQGQTSTISDNSGCPGQAGVHDLTSMVADLAPGGSYTITTNFITCGSMYPVYGGVWIDYNRDESWTAPNEQIFTAASIGTQTITFRVPTTIVPGITRMRVQVQEIDDVSTFNICNMFTFGGTKDFSINLLPALEGFNATEPKKLN